MSIATFLHIITIAVPPVTALPLYVQSTLNITKRDKLQISERFLT